MSAVIQRGLISWIWITATRCNHRVERGSFFVNTPKTWLCGGIKGSWLRVNHVNGKSYDYDVPKLNPRQHFDAEPLLTTWQPSNWRQIQIWVSTAWDQDLSPVRHTKPLSKSILTYCEWDVKSLDNRFGWGLNQKEDFYSREMLLKMSVCKMAMFAQGSLAMSLDIIIVVHLWTLK